MDKDLVLKCAKAINGPWFDKWITREKLLQIRDHKWNHMTDTQTRSVRLQEAAAVLRELNDTDQN